MALEDALRRKRHALEEDQKREREKEEREAEGKLREQISSLTLEKERLGALLGDLKSQKASMSESVADQRKKRALFQELHVKYAPTLQALGINEPKDFLSSEDFSDEKEIAEYKQTKVATHEKVATLKETKRKARKEVETINEEAEISKEDSQSELDYFVAVVQKRVEVLQSEIDRLTSQTPEAIAADKEKTKKRIEEKFDPASVRYNVAYPPRPSTVKPIDVNDAERFGDESFVKSAILEQGTRIITKQKLEQEQGTTIPPGHWRRDTKELNSQLTALPLVVDADWSSLKVMHFRNANPQISEIERTEEAISARKKLREEAKHDIISAQVYHNAHAKLEIKVDVSKSGKGEYLSISIPKLEEERKNIYESNRKIKEEEIPALEEARRQKLSEEPGFFNKKKKAQEIKEAVDALTVQIREKHDELRRGEKEAEERYKRDESTKDLIYKKLGKAADLDSLNLDHSQIAGTMTVADLIEKMRLLLEEEKEEEKLSPDDQELYDRYKVIKRELDQAVEKFNRFSPPSKYSEPTINYA